MQLSILSFLAKRPALDTSSVESVQNIPCLASPLPEEQCLALLLPKNLGESVGYFPIKPLVVMRWYFMRASACYPDLRFIDESLAKECMTVGEAFFKEILAKFSDEERNLFFGNAQSLEKYIQSVQGFIPETEKADRAAIKKVLTYREGGKHSIWIKGTMRQEIACMIQLLIHMKEDNVNKQLKYLEKRNKRLRNM